MKQLTHVLVLTQKANERFLTWLDCCELVNPIPGIVWAENPETKKESWLVGLYEKDEILESF